MMKLNYLFLFLTLNFSSFAQESEKKNDFLIMNCTDGDWEVHVRKTISAPTSGEEKHEVYATIELIEFRDFKTGEKKYKRGAHFPLSVKLDSRDCMAKFSSPQVNLEVDFDDLEDSDKKDNPIYNGKISSHYAADFDGLKIEYTHTPFSTECTVVGKKMLRFFDECRDK